MGTMPDGKPKNTLVEDGITPDPDLPPTGVDESVREAEERKWTPTKIAIWVAISLLGAVAWFMLAIVRGETVNAIWFVFAAVCTYLIGYRFYSKVIERYLLKPNDRRATPAEYKADGKDYVRTDRTSCSVTTSQPSPAPGPWWARSSQPRWATCRAPSGSSSASCWPVRSRTTS
jgi:carbon starvation protein